MVPLLWKSYKLKRVVKSAMGAETIALLEGAEHAILAKALIKEVMCIDMPLICISDKSLVTAVKSTKNIEGKRLHIVLYDKCCRKEKFQRFSSKDQLADCLTKGTASPDNLLEVLMKIK